MGRNEDLGGVKKRAKHTSSCSSRQFVHGNYQSFGHRMVTCGLQKHFLIAHVYWSFCIHLTFLKPRFQPIKREPRMQRPLRIPKTLQKNLPYKDKPKNPSKETKNVEEGRIAVVREPHEEKV